MIVRTMNGAREKFPYALYWFLTTALALAIGLVWYMSPLGLGFNGHPGRLAYSVYWATYFVGIPALLLAQLASLMLALLHKQRAAYVLPAVALVLFVGGVFVALALWGVEN